LRYFFERVAHWGLKRRLPSRTASTAVDTTTETITNTVASLARQQVGALIVLQGRDLLVRHLEGGHPLAGHLSQPLLTSIFDPHSDGHDGAVIINGNQIDQFGCRLPLSKSQDKLGGRGTRHAAALGLAELCDALCIIVSEQNGAISIARHGELEALPDPDALQDRLNEFNEEIHPSRQPHPLTWFLRHNTREKVVALALAVILWFVLVHESQVVYRTYTVPVQLPPLPPDLTLTEFSPRHVQVTLSGLRKDFFLSTGKDMVLVLKPRELAAGEYRLPVQDENLRHSEMLSLEQVNPDQVIIRLENKVVGPQE
jgi:hypothetical protein